MRQQMLLIITTVGFLIQLNSCQDQGAPPLIGDNISGTYGYTSFNLNGVEADSGTLILRKNGSHFSGRLIIIGSAQVDTIEGTVEDSAKVTLFLNPHKVSSIYLQGVIEDHTISGGLFFDTGGPPVAPQIGTFRAIRVGN